MPAFASRILRPLTAAALLALAAAAQAAGPGPDTEHLAPGFTTRPAGSRLVVLPADMELFTITAGGVEEPRADWTAAAQQNLADALAAQRPLLGDGVSRLDPAQVDDFADLVTLQRAVADAISLHHSQHGLKLSTKEDRLDWSLGDAVRPLKERTGADYALFTWVRDSYASKERKLAMVAMAMLGAISFGGQQVAYASLVDLHTGRVVWFNRLDRPAGDLRDLASAKETVQDLLKGFPALQ